MPDIKDGLIGAIVTAFPVALIFFSGWAYLSSYLGAFSVDATQVEISFTTVLVYAFAPLNTWCVIVFLVIGAVIIYLLNHFEITGKIVVPAILVLAYLLLVLVKSVAAAEAMKMAEDVWLGHKVMSVPTLPETNNNTSGVYGVFARCRDERRFRQILGLPNQIYLLCRDPDYPCWRGTMFVISYPGTILYTSKLSHRFNLEDRCG